MAEMSLDLSLVDDFLCGKESYVQSCDVQHGTGYEKLILKENVCYIVAGIIVNDDNEVLMVQEAKPSCYGKWYLPAGRMEPDETIVEAAKREVLEEAGLEFEPTTLLCIEECGGRWIRFCLTGKIVGGQLKTSMQADEESLQAKWWDQKQELPIRCKDILPLIELGLGHKNPTTARYTTLLPTLQPQHLLFLRILVVHTQVSELDCQQFSLLLVEAKSSQCEKNLTNPVRKRLHVPTSRINPGDRSFLCAVNALCFEALDIENDVDAFSGRIAGALNIGHSGSSSDDLDGVSISVIVKISSNTHDSPIPCKGLYKWISLNDVKEKNTVEVLQEKIDPSNLVPLRSLRAGN